MKDSITFFRDTYGAPTGQTRTGHYMELGSWLTTDIQNDEPELLETLQCVEDAREGKTQLEEWEGNAYAVEITPKGVLVENFQTDDRPVSYSLDETHAALLQYWEFLVPDLDDKTRIVKAWEAENGRPHPCRTHL